MKPSRPQSGNIMTTPRQAYRIMQEQHFLVDQDAINSIVGRAGLNTSDTVLEIGGGTGKLSSEIASRCGRLIIVEKDRRLCALLTRKLAPVGNVSVVPGDALSVKLPAFDKIVANMPYSITMQFFERLVNEGRQLFDSAVLVLPHSLQKKITTGVDSEAFGLPSAFFFAFYETEVFLDIGRGSFSPPPRGRSSAVFFKPAGNSSMHAAARLVLRYMFKHRNMKVDNAITRSLWDGYAELGKRLTKKEAAVAANRILSGRESHLGDKVILRLSNMEYRDITAKLISWETASR